MFACGHLFEDRLLSLFRNSEGVVSPDRHVRTRLYFTSESHVHAMANVLKYGGLFEVMCRSHACVCACVYMCVCQCQLERVTFL